MIRHIFLLSFRNAYKNKIYAVTIILSLALGFAIANLLIGFTMRELNTDSQHTKRGRIYRLTSEDPFGRDGVISFMEASIPEYLSSHYPEIESTTLVYTLRHNGLSVSGMEDEDPFHDLTLLRADSSFFDIFDYQFFSGNPEYGLMPGKIVLNQDLASILLQDGDALTQAVTVTVDTIAYPLEISGILRESTENSHLAFDGLVYSDDYPQRRGGVCYVLIHENTAVESIMDKINGDPAIPSLIGPGKIKYYLQPLQEVYYDEANARSFSKARGKVFIWISWAIVFMVLFLAGFNSLHLFFNTFLGRWKEFGMKKVMGASLGSMGLTVILEVLTYVILSFGLSMLITVLLIPRLNALLSGGLSMAYYADPRIMLFTAGAVGMLAILVILRLSKYMSRVNPVYLIRKKAQFKPVYNRWMLTIQFLISIVLLTSALTIIRQTTYIKNKTLGFRRDLLELRAPPSAEKQRMIVLRNLLKTVHGVRSISLCSGNPISDNMIMRYDLEDGTYYTPYLFIGDEQYLSTLGLSLLDGNLPSAGNTNGKLVNETFIRYFHMTDPIGEPVPGTDADYISGVVEDFNISSLHQVIPPAVISIDEYPATLIAHIDPASTGKIIATLKNLWEVVYPPYPFRYLLMDDELRKKHSDDILFSKIILLSTLVSILITCFGLFALSWGTMQEKTKEIGIHKIAGASSYQIAKLLLGNYFRVIAIATIAGIPLTVYLMRRWLDNFAYKVDIDILTFVVAGSIILLITFTTVGYHTLRSSFQNPADTLRYE